MTKSERKIYNAYQREYRKTIYYPNNKDKCISYTTAYNKKHPSKFKKWVKKYQAKNALAIYLYQALRAIMIKDKCLRVRTK